MVVTLRTKLVCNVATGTLLLTNIIDGRIPKLPFRKHHQKILGLKHYDPDDPHSEFKEIDNDPAAQKYFKEK